MLTLSDCMYVHADLPYVLPGLPNLQTLPSNFLVKQTPSLGKSNHFNLPFTEIVQSFKIGYQNKSGFFCANSDGITLASDTKQTFQKKTKL